jgi:hypothetical protein
VSKVYCIRPSQSITHYSGARSATG